ncbi:unnamed protein product [Caenorhabditis auriculariae]|uniref:Large ribosomal subunit protein mL62 n=1 Tax=Caenorhabditis auriculariae TaxID=2777116 RepID=A0A8S1HQF5_9PELO|nr:unnamed protein product [Caenorhabditis auriculariae]
MLSTRASFLCSTSSRSLQTSCCCAQLFNGVIPTEKIEKRFCLSSGPGGQNVQKNTTKTEIRFKLSEADWLSEELRTGLQQRYSHRLNNSGEFIIDSDRTRERHLNVADCFDKLRSAIYEVQSAATKRVETEESLEILRKKAAVAAQRRLNEKRRLGEKKASRKETFDF